jgi:hypothetical protein
MNQAYIIKVSGEKIPVEPKNGSDFQLDELKAAIGGGYIETVPLPQDRIMVVDEDGKRKGMATNVSASELYRTDWIVGDVLVCGRNQLK